MAAGDIKLVYGTPADVTITLASLATSSVLLTGRESTAVDNTSTLALDYIVSGKVTTGTSPTTARRIQIFAVASWDGTTYPDQFDGTDSAETITQEIKNGVCRSVASLDTTGTSDTGYHFAGVSLASVFGGTIPPKFVFFVTHDTAVNLNSTANTHQIRIQPVYQNIAP
jgi:hypothetical protein